MTVHREQNMKREDQQDATIRCLLLTSVSTCFGHHYAPSSGEQRPCYCIWCVVLVLLDVVGSAPTTATNHIQQKQNTPNAVTGPLFS